MTATEVPLSKMRPNDPCWCGSGNKFKRCHKPATDRVVAGQISPTRPVSPEIERPHYAEHGGTDDRSEPMVKDAETIARMRRTLEMSVIEGIKTSIPLHLKILAEPDFVAGRLGTGFMDRFLVEKKAPGTGLAEAV